MPRSIDQLISRADELANQFEAYQPDPADRGKEAPLVALRRAAYRRALAERDLADAVREARRRGESWAKIGGELGTSGEAARQRYGGKVA